MKIIFCSRCNTKMVSTPYTYNHKTGSIKIYPCGCCGTINTGLVVSFDQFKHLYEHFMGCDFDTSMKIIVDATKQLADRAR
jgi:transcription elongation factor Elf1